MGGGVFCLLQAGGERSDHPAIPLAQNSARAALQEVFRGLRRPPDGGRRRFVSQQMRIRVRVKTGCAVVWSMVSSRRELSLISEPQLAKKTVLPEKLWVSSSQSVVTTISGGEMTWLFSSSRRVVSTSVCRGMSAVIVAR